jgi:hypothetical protein
MKSRANPGFGVQFQVGDGDSPELFVTEAEITDVSGFGTTHRTDEVTHMSSPDGWVEHIKLGVKEGKAFNLSLNFVADSTSQRALYQTRVEGKDKHNYKIIFTDEDETYVIFEAIIADTDIAHPRDAKADLTIQVLPSGGYEWGDDS